MAALNHSFFVTITGIRHFFNYIFTKNHFMHELKAWSNFVLVLQARLSPPE